VDIGQTNAVEYRAPDAKAIRERWWRRCVVAGGIACVFGFVLSAIAWGISAADPEPDAVYIELGKDRFGVGIADQYTYWYWKSSDFFRFSLEIPLNWLTVSFAVGCVTVWLLRRTRRKLPGPLEINSGTYPNNDMNNSGRENQRGRES
jgi:hypothetical protein